jgi:hypothetical protein
MPQGEGSADDIVDEIVRALQGALEEEQGKSAGFPGQVVGSMQFTVETDDDEEESKGVCNCVYVRARPNGSPESPESAGVGSVCCIRARWR